MSCDFAYLGLAEAAELIRDKKLSPVEYATALLARIERQDPKLNAFIALMPEPALAAARAAGTQPVEPRPFLRRLVERQRRRPRRRILPGCTRYRHRRVHSQPRLDV